jgi:branched-chain amino acid transport system substrate-binding protein
MASSLKLRSFLLFVIAAVPIGIALQSCGQSNGSNKSVSQINLEGYRISEGDVAVFPGDGTFAKVQGMEAYGKGDYAIAATLFEQSLQQRPNDPEALIYKNNAKNQIKNNANGNNNPPSLKLAVSIPGETADGSGSREILRGVAQAQDEINRAGGINNRSLSIVIGTDNNDIKIAPKVAASFVSQSEILGVIGHVASSSTLATVETYTKGKLVAISPISSAVQLSNKSPYIFRTVPSDSMAARSLVDYTVNTLKRKKAIAYFNSKSDYSKSLKGEFSTAILSEGGEVVAEYDLSVSNFDAQESLTTAKRQGADVIMLASDTDSLDRGLQVVRLNESRLPILGGDDVYSPKTLEVTRATGENMVVAVPWHILSNTSKMFAARSRKLWGGDVNWRTVTAYDATQALITALQTNITRIGIKDALRAPGFSAVGASSPVRFLASGDRTTVIQLVKIVKGSRSNYGYDFMPIELTSTPSNTDLKDLKPTN